MMNILSLDSSTIYGSVALAINDDLVCEKLLTDGWQHGRLLLSGVQEILATAKIELNAIDVFACGIGAGSYTGTRIGVIAAKTLAWANNKKLVGVSSLAAMAFCAEQSEKKIVVMQNARSEEIYTGVYQFSSNGIMQKIAEDCALTPINASKLLTDNCVVIGDAGEKYPEIFALFRERNIEFISYQGKPNLATAIAKIAQKNSLPTVSPLSLTPKYLRRDESPCSFEKFMTNEPIAKV